MKNLTIVLLAFLLTDCSVKKVAGTGGASQLPPTIAQAQTNLVQGRTATAKQALEKILPAQKIVKILLIILRRQKMQ